jgi:hypothetical protein
LGEVSEQPTATDPLRALVPFIDFDELFTPEPPSNLVIPGLGIGAGPANLYVGQAFLGKSLTVLSAGLCVAAGRRFLGVHTVRRGRWLHLDHEMGRRHVKRYIVRLMLGMGIDREELRGNIAVSVYPRLNLTTADAADLYTRLFDGFDIVTADALKGLTPGVDENSSEIREYMRHLAHASEKTRAAVFLTHHAGKTPIGGKRPRKESGRGSSAIFDEAQTWFTATGEKGEPVFVTHEKTRELATPVPNFGLRIEDVEINGDRLAGLRLVHLEAEQLRDAAGPTGGDEKFEALKSSILEVVRTNDKLTSMNAVVNRVTGGNKTAKCDAFKELLTERRIVQPGGEGGAFRVS